MRLFHSLSQRRRSKHSFFKFRSDKQHALTNIIAAQTCFLCLMFELMCHFIWRPLFIVFSSIDDNVPKMMSLSLTFLSLLLIFSHLLIWLMKDWLKKLHWKMFVCSQTCSTYLQWWGEISFHFLATSKFSSLTAQNFFCCSSNERVIFDFSFLPEWCHEHTYWSLLFIWRTEDWGVEGNCYWVK